MPYCHKLCTDVTLRSFLHPNHFQNMFLKLKTASEFEDIFSDHAYAPDTLDSDFDHVFFVTFWPNKQWLDECICLDFL